MAGGFRRKKIRFYTISSDLCSVTWILNESFSSVLFVSKNKNKVKAILHLSVAGRIASGTFFNSVIKNEMMLYLYVNPDGNNLENHRIVEVGRDFWRSPRPSVYMRDLYWIEMQKLLDINPLPGSFAAMFSLLISSWESKLCLVKKKKKKKVIALKKDQETLQGKGMLGSLMHWYSQQKEDTAAFRGQFTGLKLDNFFFLSCVLHIFFLEHLLTH